jgi:tetratricopeptide (TPR) repeat protein
MENVEKVSTKEVSGFLEQWKSHPLSIPVIIILLNLSFLLVLIQGSLDEKKIQLAYIFSAFSTLIFVIVVLVLLRRKFVFYNVTNLIISEIERHIRTIQDTLADIEIGAGVAFDSIRAPQISDEVVNNVRRFEVLSTLMKSIDYEPSANDATIKALAKYYFRNNKIDKALAWLEKTKGKADSEYNFIRGLVLWKKGDSHECRECFSKSKHPKANYYKHLTYVNPHGGELSKEGLEKYIQEVSKESSPLHSDTYARIILGAAHRAMSFHFPPKGTDIGIESLQSALRTEEHLIETEEHPFAYYNAACYICLLGKFKADLDTNRKYDEILYTSIALQYFEKAIIRNSKIFEYAASDKDFEWLREKAQNDYYRSIGKYYEKHFSK